jgi:hypothetical protein
MNIATTPFTDIPSNAGRPKSDFLLAVQELLVGHKIEVQLEDAEAVTVLRSIVYKHCKKMGKSIKSRRITATHYAFYRVS